MSNKKIVGFTSGYFDIIHPGHIMMLKECKRYCDYLIVGVNEYKTKTKQPDGRYKNEPVWTPQERLLMASSCRYVDEAFLYDGEKELYKFLKNNQDNIDIRIVGDDHKDKIKDIVIIHILSFIEYMNDNDTIMYIGIFIGIIAVILYLFNITSS